MTKTAIRYAVIIYEPLPLISLCVLFRKAVITVFASINCRFKTMERHMVDFICYCLLRLASKSSFWTNSELSFKSSVKACLSASGKVWRMSLCWLWPVRHVQRETQIPQGISRTLWLNGARSSWPSDRLSWLVTRLPSPAWPKKSPIYRKLIPQQHRAQFFSLLQWTSRHLVGRCCKMYSLQFTPVA
jgi:hypothetical protein